VSSALGTDPGGITGKAEISREPRKAFGNTHRNTDSGSHDVFPILRRKARATHSRLSVRFSRFLHASPSVLQVLHLRAASFDVSGCNTVSYEFISLVRNEEAGGSKSVLVNECYVSRAKTKHCHTPPPRTYLGVGLPGLLGKTWERTPVPQFHVKSHRINGPYVLVCVHNSTIRF
jgi:hypothetical protein